MRGKFLQPSDWSKIGMLHCIVKEVIEVDELNEVNISAAAGKQSWAELFHTRTYIELYKIKLS